MVMPLVLAYRYDAYLVYGNSILSIFALICVCSCVCGIYACYVNSLRCKCLFLSIQFFLLIKPGCCRSDGTRQVTICLIMLCRSVSVD